MPDWSYHPFLRLLHARLPPRARRAALDALGAWGLSRAGARVIRFFAHPEPEAELRRDALGLAFPSPLGVGADLREGGRVLGFSARLGVGFVEAGPITLAGTPEAVGPDELARRLSRVRASAAVRVGVRLAHAPGADPAEAAREAAALVERLAASVDLFTLAPAPPAWDARERAGWWAEAARAASAVNRPLLAGLSAASLREEDVRAALAAGASGILLVCEGVPVDEAAEAVRRVRAAAGPDVALVASGGVEEPADALALLDAGATLLALGEGFAEAGPGLPGRIHEALRHRRGEPPRPVRTGWVGMALLGAGMIFAGALAWAVAVTSVVLPYDEAAVGLSRGDLAALDPRLLPFLAHDRVTLAGTMISIGAFYLLLARHDVREGAAWARTAIVVSAAVGFLSFFLFLAFGYFDPLHALAALALLPFFVAGLRGRCARPPRVPVPDLRNDRAWRLAQAGRLGLVVLGGGIVLAGLSIAFIGSTTIFVASDLDFLGASAEELRAASPALLPMVAHDRAGFGGALVADGLVALLAALWGVRRGARRLWWTFVAAGVPGFAAALGVHVAVGYLHPLHLAPAVLAALLYAASLALLHPYLCGGQTVTRRGRDAAP